MKAVITTRYGSPEVLELREVEKPTPNDDEILVRVRATTVTSGDCRIRSFTVPPVFWLPGRLALGITKPRKPVLGLELSGEVEAIGQNVTRFQVGDAVFGASSSGFGAHAEYICLPEDSVIAHKPSNLTYEQAAGVAFGGLTALNFLRAGETQAGQTVLINGASGAVGTYAVQLAKYFGAEVTGVCSHRNIDLVKSLGADHIIDYTKEDFAQHNKVYDIVFDAYGNTTFSQVKHMIKAGGAYLHVVMVLAEITAPWYERRTGIKVVGGDPTPKIEHLIFLKKRLEAGEIKPVIDRHYPIEQIAEAHRYVDTARKKGNVVITVG